METSYQNYFISMHRSEIVIYPTFVSQRKLCKRHKSILSWILRISGVNWRLLSSEIENVDEDTFWNFGTSATHFLPWGKLNSDFSWQGEGDCKVNSIFFYDKEGGGFAWWGGAVHTPPKGWHHLHYCMRRASIWSVWQSLFDQNYTVWCGRFTQVKLWYTLIILYSSSVSE